MAQRGRRNLASSVRGLARSRKAAKDAPKDPAKDAGTAAGADDTDSTAESANQADATTEPAPKKPARTRRTSGPTKAAAAQKDAKDAKAAKAPDGVPAKNDAANGAAKNGAPKNGSAGNGSAGNGSAKSSSTRSGQARNGKKPEALEDNTPTTELPAVTDGEAPAKAIPEAAVGRMAVYLRVLSSMQEQGGTTVSSEELSAAAGVNSAKLRKDLSYIGSYGTRGVGYEVEVLIGQIERTLGLNKQQRVAVVGIGNLGHALANYGGFPGRGFPVEALFDIDPDLIGVPVGGLPVSHLDDIPEVCAEREISIGVIATPPTAAQTVCDRLVAGGVQCILNFAPVVLQVPEHIEVRKVDLAVELQILSFHVARRADSTVNGQAVGTEEKDAEDTVVSS